MKLRYLIRLAAFGLTSILLKREKPILGTIILTDYCNLHCLHCAVNNIHKIMYDYDDICREMQRFHDEGIRILFFSGGEPMLWKDGGHDVRDLIAKGREMGFYLINVVTNGTVDLNIPEADVVFLSIDGVRETHNKIRGEVFDDIMENVRRSQNTNICVYSAVNSMNSGEIPQLCEMVRSTEQLHSISFNFHTPYRLTEALNLSQAKRLSAVADIKQMIRQGYPVFNLPSVLDVYLSGKWKRPCPQCIVSEEGTRFVCGRCSVIPGLCDECGYLFAAEFSTLFAGNLRAILDMFRYYTRYV